MDKNKKTTEDDLLEEKSAIIGTEEADDEIEDDDLEEDDSYEDEELAEEVRIVWHKVEVIVEENLFHRRIISQELVNVLVEVEDDSDAYDEDDGEEVRAEKLSYDVSVESGQWRVLYYPSAYACLALSL